LDSVEVNQTNIQRFRRIYSFARISPLRFVHPLVIRHRPSWEWLI